MPDTVVIPLSRYNELLDLETRVNVVVERLIHDDFLRAEDVLWILATELALERAYELSEKFQKEREEREKYEASKECE